MAKDLAISAKTTLSAPAGEIMSAWDVLSWIAFKEVRPRPDTDEAIDFTYRWSDSNAGPVLEAIEARAAIEPYCIVRPLIIDDQPWDGRSYCHRAFSPAGPNLLRWIRAKARQREGRLVTYSELAAMLRAELETLADDNRRVEPAQQELLEALRASRLTAWGKRDISGGKEDPSAVYEAVPATIFMDDRWVVTEWGSIGPDPEHPTAWYHQHGPRFREVRFLTTDVLRVWPPRLVVELEPVEQKIDPPTDVHQSRGGAPRKHDWEQFWIEVALYAAKNDLDPAHRTELQRHMRAWAAEHWTNPPDDPTIRGRIRRLFDALRAARN